MLLHCHYNTIGASLRYGYCVVVALLLFVILLACITVFACVFHADDIVSIFIDVHVFVFDECLYEGDVFDQCFFVEGSDVIVERKHDQYDDGNAKF